MEPSTACCTRHAALSFTGMPQNAGPEADRRKTARYELRLPVIFRWPGQGENFGGGFTRNISLGGIFVVSNRCPPSGNEVAVEVMLPYFPQRTTELRLECTGRVNRLLVAGNVCNGFAVAGSFDEESVIRLISG
jgi:hypothetical protein